MIAYHITRRELRRRLATAPETRTTRNRNGAPRRGGYKGWLTEAAGELRILKRDHTYIKENHKEIWGDLKTIFARIQCGNGDLAKCAYCEECFALRSSGKPDADVEHYRPKAGVAEWELGTGGQDDDCYYLLAFDPRNYLLACRVCNQDYKRNYFPIAGNRCSAHTQDVSSERPYLIHPLDPHHGDPEDLIEFDGVIPKPRDGLSHYDTSRASNTIKLLSLASGRLDLLKGRARVIFTLYPILKHLESNPHDPDFPQALAIINKDSEPHRNCARSFVRLYRSDPIKAREIFLKASKVISS